MPPSTGNKNIGVSNDQWYEVPANYFKGLADNDQAYTLVTFKVI